MRPDSQAAEWSDFLDHPGLPGPFGQGWKERYGDTEISQFRGAQLMCEKWGIKREALEEFSLESHQRAIVAIDEGRFAGQIAPLPEDFAAFGFQAGRAIAAEMDIDAPLFDRGCA